MQALLQVALHGDPAPGGSPGVDQSGSFGEAHVEDPGVYERYPVAVVTCPETVEERVAVKAKQETHTVALSIFDVQEVSDDYGGSPGGHDQQAMVARLRQLLETAKANVRNNRQLVVAGAPGALNADERVVTRVEAPQRDQSGRVVYFAMAVFEIRDLLIVEP
jgi:hypothetical protein